MHGIAKVGRWIFAFAMGGFGVQYFIYAHSAPDLINIPPYTVARPAFAYLIGAGLLIAGLSLASGKQAVLSARLLGAAFFIVYLIFYVPKLIKTLGLGAEILAMASTAFVLASALQADGQDFLRRPFDAWTAHVARTLFAVTLGIFGLIHFMYHDYLATLIPSWIPAHLFLIYFTGVAFFAAALSIASLKFTRPAGILLGSMLLLWVVVLHTPRVAHALHSSDEWASLLVAVCMGGAGFIFAGAFEKS